MKKIAQNISELPLISATTNPINYANVVDALEKRASERLNKEFQFDTLDYKTVVTMAAYFLNDTFMCSELGINLKKGILLAGPIGCGIDVIYGNRERSRFREMFLKQKESPKRGL